VSTSDKPARRGRPSTYTPELAHRICERLADGETLRAICRDEGRPDERTVREWAVDDVEGFSPQYARARQIGYHSLFDQILEIADTPQTGITTKETDNGTETRTGDKTPQRRPLPIRGRCVRRACPRHGRWREGSRRLLDAHRYGGQVRGCRYWAGHVGRIYHWHSR
jgi:hypothetical protein